VKDCWLTNGGPLSLLVHGGVIIVLGVILFASSFASSSSWVAVALLLFSRPLSCSICLMTTNNDRCHCSLFGCHVAISDVAPGFRVNREMERGGCVGLTWRKTPVDSDNVMHHHHCHCIVSMWQMPVFLPWLATWRFRVVLVVLGCGGG